MVELVLCNIIFSVSNQAHWNIAPENMGLQYAKSLLLGFTNTWNNPQKDTTGWTTLIEKVNLLENKYDTNHTNFNNNGWRENIKLQVKLIQVNYIWTNIFRLEQKNAPQFPFSPRPPGQPLKERKREQIDHIIAQIAQIAEKKEESTICLSNSPCNCQGRVVS